MELWGLYLVSFLNVASGLYSIDLHTLSFNDARDHCKKLGFLTQLESEAGIAEIRKAIWETNNKTATSFWIGLKRNKGQCANMKASLKGFSWTKGDANVHNLNITWKEEPLDTCTEERCGLLVVEYSDSGTEISGLKDAACKQKYPFICKRDVTVTCPPPTILSTHDITDSLNDPFTRHVTCGSGARFTLKCSSDLLWNVEGAENSDVSQLCLQCKSGYRRDASGNCVDINECESSDPCKHTCLNTDGSYTCVCLNNGNSDECRESTPPTTNLQNNEVQPTDSESEPIQSGGVSRNETAGETEDQNGDISNIVVPFIIALLIFVVLLVIVAAIVKGCLRRRSVKLAQKKAETVALNGSNSMEKGSENKGHQSERDCKL